MERRSRAEPWTPSRCHGCPKPRSHAGARLRSCPQQQPAWEQELRSHAMAMEPRAPKPRKQPWPLRSPTRCASAGPSPARSLRSQPFPSSAGPPPRPVHQAGRWPLRFPDPRWLAQQCYSLEPGTFLITGTYTSSGYPAFLRPGEFRQRSECEDSFDYVGSSSFKRDLSQITIFLDTITIIAMLDVSFLSLVSLPTICLSSFSKCHDKPLTLHILANHCLDMLLLARPFLQRC